MDVSKCAVVLRSSNNAMHKLASVVVRLDSREIVVISHVRMDTTDRIVSKSASVRERRLLLVIESQEPAIVILVSLESFVMLYAPNPRSV